MKKLFITLIVIASFACTKNVDEELNPINTCDTTNISFANDVLPIFNNNCNGCHSASAQLGGIILDNYEDVNQTVLAGRLIGSIKHEIGFSPMPQNASQLLQCNIDKISAWVDDGAQNN